MFWVTGEDRPLLLRFPPPFLPCSLYEYNHRPNLPLVSESICVSHISTCLLVINALEHTWVGHISAGLSSPPLPPCVCLWAYWRGSVSIMREWEWGHQSSGSDEVTPQQQLSDQYTQLFYPSDNCKPCLGRASHTGFTSLILAMINDFMSQTSSVDKFVKRFGDRIRACMDLIGFFPLSGGFIFI